MPLKMNELATRLAEGVKTQINASKVESVAELKAMIPGLIAESLGTGTSEFKTFSDALYADVLQRIPQGSLFASDKAKGYNPEIGLASLGEKALKDMRDSVLAALTPATLHGHLLSGVDAKALNTQTGSEGGFLLHEGFVAEVARKLVHISVFLGQCRVFSGVELTGHMPRETGTVSVEVGGELISAAETQFALGNLNWALNKRAARTLLSREIWRMAPIDALNLLTTMFAEQFQKTEDLLYLTGSGSKQPMGLLSQTTGMNSLAIAGVSLDWKDFTRLKHSIKSQYRLERANCAFMMNDATIQLAADLADDQNRPIFLDRGPSGIAGANVPPQTVGFILGYPVLENPYMPGPVTEGTVVATSKVVFANFSRGYFAFKGPQMEVRSSDQTTEAFEKDGLSVRATDYLDGKPAIPEAVAIMSGVK